MPRKPNYKFERLERERAKAAKKATRLEARKEKADKRKAENAGLDLASAPSGDPQEDSGPV